MANKKNFFVKKSILLKSKNSLDDLLNDEFDQMWLSAIDNKENWQFLDLTEDDVIDIDNKIFFSIPPEQLRAKGVVDDKSIIYKYNKQNFRSDDFIVNHEGLHILFAGCSETEGVGGNIDHAWSKILYNKISEKTKCSGFFNLARSGWGYSKIIPNAMIYFKKYGYPDYFFIMLPNCQRKIVWDKNTNMFRYWQIYPDIDSGPNKYSKVGINGTSGFGQKITSSKEEYLEDYISFLYNWKNFIEFCHSKNITVLFSSWDMIDRENLSESNIFNNYVLINKEIEYEFSKEYIKNFPIAESKDFYFTKRDGHSGLIFHECWAYKFYEKYKETLHDK